MKTLDIIVPVYNEEDCIEETFNRLCSVRNQLFDKLNVSFLFINDGSKDSSIDILKKLSIENHFVKVIDFSRNFGHQIAVTAGIENTNADYVAIIDADLQDPPELIIDMYNKSLEGFDIVYGKRLKRENETAFKKITAFGFYRVLNSLCNLDIPTDTGDFRFITKDVVGVLKSMPEHNRFIRGMVPWVGFKSAPIEFNRDERFAGETHYPLKAMLRLAANGIFSFSLKPLKFINWLGIFLLLIAMFSLLKMNLLSATICFVGALQLFAIGIIGIYIGRIYEEVLNRPLYIIKDKYNL